MIHRLPIPTPFRRRPRQLLPDRGRPADAGRRRPELGRARWSRSRSALGEHGRRIEDLERIVITHQHTDHLGLVGILAERSERRGLRARPARAGGRGLQRLRRAQRRARAGADAAATASRATSSPRSRAMSRAYRGWGGSAPVDARAARRRRAGVRRAARFRSCTGPATRRRTRSSSTRARRRAARRRPPDQAHLLQPADLAAARRALRRARRRAPAGAADVHGVAARRRARCRSRPSSPATATPFGDHAALIDERFEMHERRARKIARADRRAPAHGARDRAGDLGQRRGHAGVPHAQRGARATSTCWSSAARCVEVERRRRAFTPRDGRRRSHPRRAARRGRRCWPPRRARSTSRTRSCS